jgi:hypothetical protein
MEGRNLGRFSRVKSRVRGESSATENRLFSEKPHEWRISAKFHVFQPHEWAHEWGAKAHDWKKCRDSWRRNAKSEKSRLARPRGHGGAEPCCLKGKFLKSEKLKSWLGAKKERRGRQKNQRQKMAGSGN